MLVVRYTKTNQTEFLTTWKSQTGVEDKTSGTYEYSEYAQYEEWGVIYPVTKE